MTHPVLRKLHAYARLLRKQANTFEIRYGDLLSAIAIEKTTFKTAKKDPNQPFWWTMKNAGLIFIAVFTILISPTVLVQLGGAFGFWNSPGFWEVSPGEGLVDEDLFARIFIIALPTILIAMATILIAMATIGYFFTKQCLQAYLMILKLLNAGQRPVQFNLPL